MAKENHGEKPTPNKFLVDLPTIRLALKLGFPEKEILKYFPELNTPLFLKIN